jgi:uncharacterized membrane protein
MKKIEVQVPSDAARTVVRVGDDHGGFSPSHHEILVSGEPGWSAVVVNVPNRQVGPFLAAVEEAVAEAEFFVPTAETLPIATPVSDVRDRVADVSRRSTLELVLDVLQSLGTWKGMLLYAVVSGVVAAYGVIFSIPFLLTAAMLIAPLGAPAMVCVVGVTVGDVWMVRRGGLRFVVALLILAVAAAALGLAYGLSGSTPMMETLTSLSVWSALLGVAGGAAGAQALVQAERDSLVTATATGFLVAVSLSPPSAVLGLAAALGRWDYVVLMTFLILLTLSGILFGGWLSLTARGVGPGRVSAERGRGGTRWALAAGAALVLAALVVWQTQRGPRFRKADMARAGAKVAGAAVATAPAFRLITADARFTPTDASWHEGEGMLVEVVVKATGQPTGAAEPDLRAAIEGAVRDSLPGVHPFVALTVIPE